MNNTEIIQIIAGFISSLCFGILFNMRGKRLFATAFGGLIALCLFLLLSQSITNEPIVYFLVSVFISLYSEIIARLLKTPATPVVTTALVPLIPGGSLYYTMAYAFQSDFNNFVKKAVYTLQLASALALGIVFVTAMFRILMSQKMGKSKSSGCKKRKEI